MAPVRKVELTYDVLGCSVRIRWYRGPVLMLDLVRVAATRTTVSSGRGIGGVSVAFETEGVAGSWTFRSSRPYGSRTTFCCADVRRTRP
jgi:hypothetical protein